MNVPVALAAALGSSLTYAAATVLQHRAAGQAPAGRGQHVGLVAFLATRPMWLAGIAADVAALGLHIFALSAGQLALVQGLLVSGLIFALPASVVLEGRRPSLAEWNWATVLAAALGVFLVAAHPRTGNTASNSEPLAVAAAITITVTLSVVGAAVGVFRRHRAALLGLAAGIAYGLTAALLKQTTTIGTGHHPLQLLASWPLYALLGVGAAALIVNQAAYQAGPLAASLPPLTIADPLIAIALGSVIFDEDLAHSLGAVSVEALSFVAMTAAVIRLAQLSTRHRTPPTAVPLPQPDPSRRPEAHPAARAPETGG